MATGAVGAMCLVLWALMCMVAVVECSWAWERNRDNYTPINRHHRIPHVGVRRSILDRFWGETTPNNPFFPTRPSALGALPRLSGNDFIASDDADYEDDLRDAHWLPQLANKDHKSLEELQHILEGKLGPINNPSPAGQRRTPEIPSHKDEKKKPRNRQRKYRQRFTHEMSPSGEERPSPSSTVPGEGGVRQMPDFGDGTFSHDGPLVADDQQFSKAIFREFQEPLSMPEHFTNSKQIPKDFINPDQLPKDFGMAEPSSNDHLTTDPFVSELQAREPFQDHLLLDSLSNNQLQNPEHLLNLHTDQTLGEVDLPQIFPNLDLLGNTDQPESFIHQDRPGHFGLPNADSPDILPEGGDGLEWLPPSLSDLNLPSHGHMISTLEQQKLSKEAHRDACHARNLHSCGSRLIDEFAFGPDNPDKCRIREEFLDCMEQVMKLPCELHGERYSREGSKLIRDKIKTLLWSAQGCILGYST